jgi:hypothetical protein
LEFRHGLLAAFQRVHLAEGWQEEPPRANFKMSPE